MKVDDISGLICVLGLGVVVVIGVGAIGYAIYGAVEMSNYDKEVECEYSDIKFDRDHIWVQTVSTGKPHTYIMHHYYIYTVELKNCDKYGKCLMKVYDGDKEISEVWVEGAGKYEFETSAQHETSNMTVKLYVRG